MLRLLKQMTKKFLSEERPNCTIMAKRGSLYDFLQP